VSPARRPLAAIVLALAASACQCTTQVNKYPHQVASFKVVVNSVQVFTASTSPLFRQWSEAAPMPMPRLGALLDINVTALDEHGELLDTYESPISFRVTPGHVLGAGSDPIPFTTAFATGSLATLAATDPRMLLLKDGVGHGYVVVEKVFAKTVLQAQDSPPQPVFQLGCDPGDDTCNGASAADAGLAPEGNDAGYVEYDGGRTFAAGVSDPIWFVSPTLADTQALPGKDSCFDNPPSCSSPCTWSNKEAPFTGNFLTVEARPPFGDMIVTAITAEGFYVTDMLAAPVTDPFYTGDPSMHRTLAGTFGHMYVYSYSFPEGLFVGDRVLSLTGTVQEFSGDTQFVFPSWIRKVEQEPHAVDERPPPLLLDFSDPNVNGKSPCDVGAHQICDNGSAASGAKGTWRCVESVIGENCAPGQVARKDVAGDGSSHCTCETSPADTCTAVAPLMHCDLSGGQFYGRCVGGCPDVACPEGQWCVQHRCVDPPRWPGHSPCDDVSCRTGERCNKLTGACECGQSMGYRVSLTPVWYPPKWPCVLGDPNNACIMQQLFAYSNNNVEIETLESSIVKIANARPSNFFVGCDHNGNSNVPGFSWYVPTFTSGAAAGCPDFTNSGWYCYDTGEDTADCSCNRDCTLGVGPEMGKICSELFTFRQYGQWIVETEPAYHTRLAVQTRDALPDFDPTVFIDAKYAGCRIDVTGVLRQVQAARPRWLILARDERDVCCRVVDPGGMCPTAENGGKCPKCPEAQGQ
jgi:hypothetical protein